LESDVNPKFYALMTGCIPFDNTYLKNINRSALYLPFLIFYCTVTD